MEPQKSDTGLSDSDQTRYSRYVSELKSLDPADPELTQKVNELGRRHGVNSSDRYHDYSYRSHSHRNDAITYQEPSLFNNSRSSFSIPFLMPSMPFFSSSYDPFRSFNRNIDSVFNNMNSQFNNMNSQFNNMNSQFDQLNANEWKSLEEDMPDSMKGESQQNTHNAYCKYTSSFTSYDETGKKKAVTVSGIEKKVGNQQYASKKKTTVDGDDIVEEHYRPDGSVTKTNKKNFQLPSATN